MESKASTRKTREIELIYDKKGNVKQHRHNWIKHGKVVAAASRKANGKTMYLCSVCNGQKVGKEIVVWNKFARIQYTRNLLKP